MTYDMMQQGSGGRRSYHADIALAKSAVEGLVKSGCPPSKIMLGIPAYARHWDNPGDVKSYAELIDELEKTRKVASTSTSENDEQPLLNREDVEKFHEFNGYIVESPKRVREKVEYARNRNMAGVFFWELGQDKQHLSIAPGGILLESAAAAATAGADRTFAHENLDDRRSKDEL